MQPTENNEKLRRLPIKLTIREDILRDAKALDLNTSKAAESGIFEAVQSMKAEQWLQDNRAAIKAYNQDIENRGLIFTPDWLGGED